MKRKARGSVISHSSCPAKHDCTRKVFQGNDGPDAVLPTLHDKPVQSEAPQCVRQVEHLDLSAGVLTPAHHGKGSVFW